MSAEGSIMSGLQRISRAAIIINIMGRVVCNTETTLSRENLNYIRYLRWKCQIKFILARKGGKLLKR